MVRPSPLITSDTHHFGLCRRLFLSDGMGQQRCRRHGARQIGIGASLAKAVPVAPAGSFDVWGLGHGVSAIRAPSQAVRILSELDCLSP
jgi:hypothetical protein